MRNLKKVLGLVLCLAMMLSVMVVGAGAAFSDQSKIDTKHQEAVDACVSLNIINGMPDGSFDPTGNVTREQMAKMICILMNGGKEPVLGSGASTFTDVTNDRWSCAYIQSCVSQGIVAGIGNNLFDPAGNVTGTQAARMLLVALGYDQDHQKYLGDGWAVNVNTDASAKGFYADLEDIDPMTALSREHAAQMIWNALNAFEVEYKSVLTTENGQITSKTTVSDRTDIQNNKITLLQDKYRVGIPKGILESVEKTAGKDTYSVVIDGVTYNDVAKDYSDLLGREVKIMIKAADKAGESASIIGIYSTDNNTVATAQKGDMDDLDTNKATVNGATYKPDSRYATMEAVPVWFTPGDLSDNPDCTVADLADYQTISLIDNDGDSKIDLAVCTPVAFAQIDTLTSEDLNLAAIAGGDAIALEQTDFDLEDDDVTLYSGADEDDYVVVINEAYTVDGFTVITKATSVTGTINATKGDITDVKADGNWYSVVANDKTEGLRLNKAFDMYLFGTYVFAAEKNAGTATAEDVLFVDDAADIGDGLASKDGKVEAKVYFSDGTSQNVIVSKIYPAALKDADDDDMDPADFGADNLINKMWMFDKDGSDYVLTELATDVESLSYDNYMVQNNVRLEDGKTAAMRVTNDSIVFVKADNGDDSEVKVLSGKAVAGWADRNVAEMAGLYDTTNGYNYVQVGAIVINTQDTVPGADDNLYGYVTSKPENSKVDGTNYTTVSVWNGTETITVTGKTSEMRGVVKGVFIEYTLDSANYAEVQDVKTVDDAVTIDAFDDESVNGSDYADTYVIIGVNVKDVKGVAAKVKTADNDIPNAVIFFNNEETPEITAVFIASNNKMLEEAPAPAPVLSDGALSDGEIPA